MMYNASKRLQAIRRQLLHMDEQYRNDIDEESSIGTDTTPDKCLLNPEKLARKGCGPQQAFSDLNVGPSPVVECHEQSEATANSMDIDNVFATIVDCSSSVDVDDIPLSEELRSAISNMEDLDDVDNLVCNVISAVQVDASYDTDLETLENTVTLPRDSNVRDSSLSTDDSQGTLQTTADLFMSAAEEESWRKDRRKKDNHNIIERRRRYNINDRIKELGSLLPSTIPSDLKQNKGSILKASVEYIKELKKDKQKLHNLEDSQKRMNTKYQKLLFRIFQLELKLKLYGLTEDFEDFRVKKKKPKRRLTDIDAVVEGHCKQNITSPGQQTKVKCAPTYKKNRSATVGSFSEQKSNLNIKQDLRQHLNKKMAAGKQQNANLVGISEFYRDLENQNEIQEVESPMLSPLDDMTRKKQILQSCSTLNDGRSTESSDAQENEEIIELSSDQCNILLDLFENHGNVNEILINSDSITQPEESVSTQECLSPVTSTSNMLEALLRGKGGNSDSSGFEDSTESNIGLR